MIAREPIFAALFALVTSIPGVRKCARRAVHWDDVSPADCPAVFLVQKGQDARTQTRTPTVWTLDCELIVYVKTDGNHSKDASPGLNAILDAIDLALEPKDFGVDYRQTLGGLVHDCKIEGRIETDEGLLGETAVAIIPVKLTVA